MIKKPFGYDSFQNMFVYQPTFKMLELKGDEETHYVICWISEALFLSKLLLLHGAFLSNIKHFVSKIAIYFNNTP